MAKFANSGETGTTKNYRNTGFKMMAGATAEIANGTMAELR
jgi:hypothetical protein